MKTGIYETDYGNAAVVCEDISREFAWDLDSDDLIPMEVVTSKWVRNADEVELEDFIYIMEEDS